MIQEPALLELFSVAEFSAALSGGERITDRDVRDWRLHTQYQGGEDDTEATAAAVQLQVAAHAAALAPVTHASWSVSPGYHERSPAVELFWQAVQVGTRSLLTSHTAHLPCYGLLTATPLFGGRCTGGS